MISAGIYQRSISEAGRCERYNELSQMGLSVGGRMILPEFGRDFFLKLGRENFS